MSKTTVVHIDEPYDIYIGRAVPRLGLKASPWANPFRLRREADRQTVIEQYRAWLQTQPDLLARIGELRGKRLACWCKESGKDIACHGDVLAELADAEPEDEEEEEAGEDAAWSEDGGWWIPLEVQE